MFGIERSAHMTEQEMELFEIIDSCPDKEGAIRKAIEIFSLFAELPSTSQEPSAVCPQESF